MSDRAEPRRSAQRAGALDEVDQVGDLWPPRPWPAGFRWGHGILAEHAYPGAVLWGMTSGEAGTYVYWSFIMSGGTETDAALHYVSSDDGTTWSEPVIMGDLTNNYIGPYYSFITGGDGAVHAFWTEHPKNGGSMPPLLIRYSRLTP